MHRLFFERCYSLKTFKIYSRYLDLEEEAVYWLALDKQDKTQLKQVLHAISGAV